MKKRIFTAAGFAALAGLAAFGLASCGEKEWKVPTPKDWKEPTIPTYSASATDGGSVVNIRVWNDEFVNRFKDYYPGAVETKAGEEFEIKDPADQTKKLKVVFQTTANQNNAYQIALDEALDKQATAAADQKVDMFLLEADYALKYVNTNNTVAVDDIGITTTDTAQMYKYTKDIATSNGKLKALSWQATPGLFAYRADIAKEVLGTDDPTEVQKALANWTKFDETAKKMKEKNYCMLSGYDDAYRVFSNTISKPLVDKATGIINIDPQLEKWIDQTKEYTDKGYNNKTSLWDPAWSKQQTIEGNTFGFFYSTWGVNFTLADNAKIEKDGKSLVGQYRVCEGPASYFWGGTWLACANGSDNKTAVADIMKKLTCDKAIAKKITEDTLDYTNNKEAMNELAQSTTFGPEKCKLLGGQNHIKLFAAAADKIVMDKTTIWDQGFNENIQSAFKDFFEGKVSRNTAYWNFYKKLSTTYTEFEY